MSVPITVILSKADEFSRTYSDDTFFDQLEEGKIGEEEFCTDELSFQMLLLECYDGFRARLPEDTRHALDEFANCVFWSWRVDNGKQQLDIPLESEGLDSSYTPASAEKFASLLHSIDWKSVENSFISTDVLRSPADFRLYYDEWKTVFEKSSSTGESVFVFVFP
ncbi:hypothetical protein [Cerasicoccus fimbriatus]|uniref:hypothetical protein n=1 Tax=Cerasicoccus fimbriatus TaxID=3014554 RepID=UPI0022B3ED3C|nr:hypothetical protein [Cerasicoccus sp. TK19100]